jgi:S1-C subfamily serine protease
MQMSVGLSPIGGEGVVLTIGYLSVEALAAEIITSDGDSVSAKVVGYDHETGFGLLRAVTPLSLKPMPFGKSDEIRNGDVVFVASGGGRSTAAPVALVAKREFVGNWEYMLDEAIFTSPPRRHFSGAALINSGGQLVGVGSLAVRNATMSTDRKPGNMFVPIDRLPPILPALRENGRIAGPDRPWLGVSTDEIRGRLMVSRVAPGGPAEEAGLNRGDSWRQRGSANEPRGFLSESLGHRGRGRVRFARRAEAKLGEADRHQIDKPSR